MRHGESTWIVEGRFQGRRDPPLSPLGERQAGLVAEALDAATRDATLPIPAGPPVAVWHSPLARARQTAEPIARRCGAAALLEEPGLTEIGQGTWEGQLHAEVLARDAARLAAWRRTPTLANAPGGERLLDAADRVRSALGRVRVALSQADPAAGTSLSGSSPVAGYGPAGAAPWGVIVAHDGIFRLALLTLLELPYERFWSFPFGLCLISVIELGGDAATLRAHNLADHLAPLASVPGAAAEARGDRRGAL